MRGDDDGMTTAFLRERYFQQPERTSGSARGGGVAQNLKEASTYKFSFKSRSELAMSIRLQMCYTSETFDEEHRSRMSNFIVDSIDLG